MVNSATILCRHCDGKGYISIRDCSGEIQREETCSFCRGLGTISKEAGSGAKHCHQLLE